MLCVHCGIPLTDSIGQGLFSHANGLSRCQNENVPYGHMGHPNLPCPGGSINQCLGSREDFCDHYQTCSSTYVAGFATAMDCVLIEGHKGPHTSYEGSDWD